MRSLPYSRFLVGSLLLGILAGCAGTPGSGPAGSAPVRSNSNVISAEEIRTAAAANAFDLVTGLRPTWLYKRGPQSVAGESDIIVYMEGARMGGIPALRDIPASTLGLLEYLDATKANYRFGRGHPYGAIILHLAKGNSGE